MDNQSISRINELSKKSKTVGLTEEEKAEQKLLREKYRAAFRASLMGQLDNYDIKKDDGSIVSLKSIRENND